MRRATTLLITGLATLLLLVSCSEELPRSELDRFISQIEAMPREAAIDTLHRLAGRTGQDRAFAQYQLGNIHYSAAVDSARMRGWNDEYAKAFLDSAQHWFEEAVATDSTFVEAYVNLGALWDDRADMMAVRRQREERIATAREMYEHALELRPHDEKARCNLGSLYKRRNDFERAMQEYMTALEYDPRSALAHYNLAILFATQKIYREAITEFELAVKYDPEGDIGDRSRENIQIIRDLLESQEAEARKRS